MTVFLPRGAVILFFSTFNFTLLDFYGKSPRSENNFPFPFHLLHNLEVKKGVRACPIKNHSRRRALIRRRFFKMIITDNYKLVKERRQPGHEERRADSRVWLLNSGVKFLEASYPAIRRERLFYWLLRYVGRKPSYVYPPRYDKLRRPSRGLLRLNTNNGRQNKKVVFLTDLAGRKAKNEM